MPELLKIMQEKDNLKKDIFAVFLLFLIPFLLYFPSYSFDFLH